MKSAITISESKDLIRLEAEVEAGRKSWISAGRALIEIRDRQLFRNDYDDFWQYCADRWGWKKRNALYVIESYSDYAQLPEGVQNFAQSASIARELSKVPEENHKEVLEHAAKNGRLTAKSIREAAHEEAYPDAQPQEEETPRFRPSDGFQKTEPRVTEWFEAVDRLVDDAIKTATDKQLVSMSVALAAAPKRIKAEIYRRKQEAKAA